MVQLTFHENMSRLSVFFDFCYFEQIVELLFNGIFACFFEEKPRVNRLVLSSCGAFLCALGSCS